MDTDGKRLVEREVRANDPNLSTEANELLTDELREAVGSDHVAVPVEAARGAGTLGASERRTLVTLLAANRLLVGITFAVLLIVGVIVGLATGSWWAVVAAAGVHALGTLAVISMALRLSTEVEHVAPSTAARLEDEGVADPDRALTDLIESYGSPRQARGAAEVVSTGHNRVTVAPGDDPLRSTVEQKTAITPAGSPVEPSTHRGAPALLPIAAVGGSLAVGIGAAIALGGLAWVGAAVLVGASLVWLMLVRQFDATGETQTDESRVGRQPGDDAAGRRRRLLPTVAVVVAAVVGGVILVGAIGGYLS
jgi:hypothetical protein